VRCGQREAGGQEEDGGSESSVHRCSSGRVSWFAGTDYIGPRR
jgi:hypothetical protein